VYEQIPTILNPEELLNKALGRASKIQKEDKVSFYRVRKTIDARAETTRELLVDTLTRYVKSFPSLDRIDTYERELIDILVGVDALRKALGRISGATSVLEGWGVAAVREIRRADSEEDILAIHRRFVGKLSSLVDELAEPLAFLAKAREAFHQVPQVTPGDATIVIAGYPNVGKSSLIGRLSNARPEIAPYPYTTKQANVGHFLEPGMPEWKARRFQLIDTPGLLEKTPERRNAIEQQAVLALTYLADVILFVIDPTESCGYTLADQEHLLEIIRKEFRDVPILVVENKVDLGPGSGLKDRLHVSCTTGQGIEPLRTRILEAVPHDPFAAEFARGEFPDA
jgi:nucleolar GTP-binding protein